MSEAVAGTTLDVERLRAETPGCANVIHFNAAGAALMPRPVLDAVIGHLQREAAIGGYEALDEAQERYEAVYASIARLLGARPDEIALIENATRAFDMGFHALPLRRGDVVLVSLADYASNYLAALRRVREQGIDLRPVPNDAHGQISLDALERMLGDPRVRAVSLTYIPTNSGLVQPAEEVGQRARAAGAWYVLDATQAAGQLPLDVRSLDCDLLAATGRKFLRGPRGTGFLYVRRERLAELHPPFVDLRAATWTAPDAYLLREDARRFENWESNVAGLLGLGTAVDYALALGIERTWPRIQALAAQLRRALAAVPGVTVTDPGETLCGICSFTVAGHEPEGLKQALAELEPRINVTTSTRSSTMLDMDARGLAAVVRASLHYYNTEREIDRFVAIVADLA
ncbi:MAG TPA: aminotransferase class V-fold PLP-dependent enzyme [Dehalococcoidia bacterium]|nr:aminotransferase class V-fold PLP-dependent enzyme [Dehalococcoidia bacterium]